jgi:hypothetical protein
MIEYAFRGSLKYWAWITVLLALSSLALLMFILQQREGLGVEGLVLAVGRLQLGLHDGPRGGEERHLTDRRRQNLPARGSPPLLPL